MTVAVDFGSIWVACKERSELMRLDAATLRTTKVLRVGRSGLIAVATGLGSLWALDESFETLDRIDPAANAVTARIALGDGKPYNVWVGAGAVWVCDDDRPGRADRPGDEPGRRADRGRRWAGRPRVRAVTAATAASGPLDVHGLFADDRGVWLADNTHGVLYRVPG
jgi:hypothetical protein